MSSSATKQIDLAFAEFPPQVREMTNTLRALVHKAEPGMEETWKWGACFERNGMVCGVWGFKKHAGLIFHRGAELGDKYKLFNSGLDNAKMRMIKFHSMEELDEKKLISYIKEAVKLNASGKKPVAAPLEIPEALSKWFLKNKKAKTFFDSIARSYQKAMVQHISSAKQEKTRKKRFTEVTELLKKEKKELR